MFDIEYKGGNGVVITTKQIAAVIDPKLSTVGLKDMKVKDVVEIATEDRFKIDDDSARLIVEGPGEYEVGDFSITGVGATRHIDTPNDEKKSTVYRIEVGDVRIALLGNIAPQLSEDQLEALGVVDILILPVGGGGYTLDATSAAALTRQIDPKVVLPIHYADETLRYEVPQDSIDLFIKELGAPVEKTAKYKVKNNLALPSVLTTIELARS
jgi:L-ascorbate metabolism protein UlaG (beta-lactamase superfamily)